MRVETLAPILAWTLLALPAAGAPPTPVVIDFDQLPPGTVVDTQFPEVLFATGTGVEIQTAGVPFAPSPPNIICTVPIAGGDTCVADVFLLFAEPVGDLTFQVVGAKTVGQVAEVKVFELYSPVETATVPITNLDPGGTTPVLVDLSSFSGVTDVEIVNVTDPSGIGYDNFAFETGVFVFASDFESGDTSAWTATVSPPAAILTVNAPPSIMGDYPAGDAAFGMPLDPAGVSGLLEYVDDGDDEGGLGSIRDACQPLIAFPSGMVALIDRGNCDFSTQVLNAQNAGAIAAVVVNDQGDLIFTMPPGADAGLVFISSVFIGQSDGDLIKAELGLPIDVTLRLPSGAATGGAGRR